MPLTSLPRRILHLEDNLPDAELIRILVTEEWPECEIKLVTNRFSYTSELQCARYDLILSDYSLAGFDGMEALHLARERVPDTPFLFLSGTIGEDRAIEAVKAGAHDYVLKDRMKRLLTAIPRALRERDEARHREASARRIRDLAEMVNQAREAIVITDLDDNFLSWNTGAFRLFGWKNEEVIGKSCHDLFKPEAQEQLRLARLETTVKGEWSGELRLHTKHGVPIILESHFTLVCEPDGRPKARLSSHSDITDRKRLEEHFLRAQRIENIGLLAAGIAHDLNNVLAPMTMATPLLREWVKDPNGAEIVDMLEKSAERGCGLVRQILGFTSGDNPEPETVQLQELIRDLVVVISSTFPKMVRLEDRIAPDLWTVQASAVQVHQVLLNLCVNARDAMPNGGVLRLIAENCELTSATAAAIPGARPGNFVMLGVEDTGTGIPPSVLEHMWEPFFTTKESGKGTGLGLSTVRGILKNHGGFIDVKTQAGQGTTFRAFLPVAPAPTLETAPATTRRPSRGRGELIMVVDDELEIRDMTAAMLSRQGYRVIVANDGSEATALFNQYRRDIRLVIADLHMPGIDGLMLTRMLQRINPAVRVLLMSGLPPESGAPATPPTKDPLIRCLPKPFKLGVLLQHVEELLQLSHPFVAGVA